MSRNIKDYLTNKDNDYTHLEKEFKDKTGKSLLFDNVSIEEVLNNKKQLTASIVIPAWNAEDTILKCLTAIETSSFNQKFPNKLEVIVTDDGSTDDTFKILKNNDLNINLIVVHQENQSQGPAMNAGISVATNDIIIEVDADTILNHFAIENLMCRHQFHKDTLYTGFRYYVEEDDPFVDINNISENGTDSGFYFNSDERISFYEPGWPNNMVLASNHYKKLGNLKGLWMPNDDNEDPWIIADMVFGMLFSLPRDIFCNIGGFDDRFEGWGCDDGFVGAKAVSEGVYIVPVYTATGFHISHPFRTEDKQAEYNFNRKFFYDFINSTDYNNHPNWISIANKRIIDRYDKKFDESERLNYKKPKTKEMDIDHLLGIGNYKESYKRLTERNIAKDKQYHINLAKTLRGLERYEESIPILDKFLLENDDEKGDVYFQKFISFLHKGDLDNARKTINIIVKNYPEYPELSYWYYRDPKANLRQGERYLKQKFFKIAQKCFEAVLIRDTKNETAKRYRRICLNNN